MDLLLAMLTGVGLAAACGFRVFVPMWFVAVADRAGYLTLGPGFEWLSSDFMLVVLTLATVLEIVAYYVPWLDNLLDSVATPAAVIAGTVLMAAMVTQMHPALQWILAAIAGGGTAAVVQSSTVMIRGTSTVTTGGVANPVVSTAELVGASTLSAMTLMLPLVAITLLVAGALMITLFVRRRGQPMVREMAMPVTG